MDHLPTEIVISIFKYLPQKYISIGSTVCKKWYTVLSNPLFCRSIHIYSLSQIKRCIHIAKTKKIDDQLFSHYVEDIYFHTDCIIPNMTFIKIIETFPHLQCIKGISTLQPPPNTGRVTFSSLNQLEYIFNWYQNLNKQWMDTLDNQHHKIKSLEFFMEEYLIFNNKQSHSSTLPIIYFTALDTVLYEGTDMSIQCKIHTIKLPTMPSLTHLSISFLYRKGDEQMLEFIHQSCPQLKSLSLEIFNMHTSNIFHNKMIHQLIEPSVQVKELCIGRKFNDPTCFDYLSFKYPNLESLSLVLEGIHLIPEPLVLSFKLAIYKMITQYGCLKKLNIRFTPGTTVSNFQCWPHTELLEWLQQNPMQLDYLQFPYDLSVNNIETINNDSPNLNQFSSNTVAFINNPIQQHDYLDHLSSLTLMLNSDDSIDTLFYFYLCSSEKKMNTPHIISNSIEKLELGFKDIGNIYFWLDGFPNLTSLSITGHYGDAYVLDYIESTKKFQHMICYLKEKIEQQEKIKNSSTSSSSSSSLWLSSIAMSEKERDKTYKLKKLEIKYCCVHFEKFGWNGLFKNMPDLKIIILSNINLTRKIDTYYTKGSVKKLDKQSTFDLSHLSLDLLKINNFNVKPYLNSKTLKVYFVKELMIHETSLGKEYYITSGNITHNTHSHFSCSTTLNIKCKYIEYIDFYHR